MSGTNLIGMTATGVDPKGVSFTGVVVAIGYVGYACRVCILYANGTLHSHDIEEITSVV